MSHVPGESELLADLNPGQIAAVTHDLGPLLILAGAGTGKTRAITRRIAWLVSSQGVPPGGVLAITFTNKAAREMRERVEALVPIQGMWISTFHACCARILRRDIEWLGARTRQFSIYDTADKNQLIKEVTRSLGLDTTRFRPSWVGGWISAAKNEASEAFADGEESGGGYEDEALGRISMAYELAMRAANAVDFDDLLLLVVELFDRHPHKREEYAARFQQVMVDEYQDTNRIQYRLMRHLASVHGNVAVCGDPDQSIYAWRGADVRNILAFEEDFPSARIVRLEQNYRSTQIILRAAQAMIANNVMRHKKGLYSQRAEGKLLSVIECADEDDEAREIAEQILARIGSGVPASQMALLYRVNFMQRALERALRLGQVPYRVVAGLEFYERREIRDLIAYLKLVANPDDEIALRRVINVPTRGIGETSLARLADLARQRGLSLGAAVRSEEMRSMIRGRAGGGLRAFADWMQGAAHLADGPAETALRAVLDETGYLDWIAAQDSSEVDREANIEELLTHAQTYDRSLEDAGMAAKGLRGFLQDVALVSDADEPAHEGGRVALMTMHAAKGLEFDVVLVAGCEEELLPHGRALEEGGRVWGLEEERRLFYVALTRARDDVVLTHARIRRHFGQNAYREPSRFLGEIPPELVEGRENRALDPDLLGEFQPEEYEIRIREGDLVEHDEFGRGRVDRLLGRGANARATVYFEQCGQKQLLLQYARLHVLSGEEDG
jgi:DNA helicase-2/ATP-dependent DNA helicase PcrA